MTRNKIVLVPFPFDDFSSAKVRPALCLTDEISEHKHVIVAFITSKIPTDITDSDIIIKKGSENSTGTGLVVDSVIRLHKMVVIPAKLINRKLGEINQSIQFDVKSKIRKLFNC
jgi:mRNA interferase MazF